MIRCCNIYLPSRTFAAVLLDGLCILCAGLVLLHTPSPAGTTLLPLALALLLGPPIFYLCDLYDFDAPRARSTTLVQTLRATGIGVLVMLPAALLLGRFRGQALPDAREIEVGLLALMAILCTYRTGIDWVHQRLSPKENVLLVGSSPTIELLARTITFRKGLPLRLRGVLVAPGERPRSPVLAAAACGTYQDLAVVTRSLRAQRVAVCAEAAQALSPAALLDLRRQGSHVDDALTMYEAMTGRVPVDLLAGRNMSYGRALAESSFRSGLYRVAGALGAAAALLLAAPLMIAVAIAIKLDSRGPVFYRQERVGLHGQSFFVRKFRSMRVDCEAASGPVWAQLKDPRITRIGRTLRSLRIDELPQFFNVLSGEMAFVGPRPERPHFVALLEQRIQYYGVRHGVRPGITGWAQVCAGYGASVDDSQEKLEYDLFYLKNRSLALDMLVLLKTVKIVICGKGAR